ncbi:hypothetical protein ABPG72_003805 [Tetrahymena utriculariae]
MSHQTNQDWSKWDLIHPQVLQSLKDNNFNNPTEIQAYVLNTYRNYNDFLIASQTGSGKTLSFGIPIVSEILYDKSGAFAEKKKDPKKNEKYIRCLIIAPTRELVLQIEKHLNQISQNSKEHIRIGSIVGGISKEKQRRILSYIPDILIATPGRLWDMIDNYEHECLERLYLLDYLVLDEADRMVELGHFDELDKILEKVYNKGEMVENKADIQRLNQLIKEKKTKTIQLRTKAELPQSSKNKLDQVGENEVMTLSGDEAKKFFASLKKNNQLDQNELKGINLDFFDDENYINSTQDKESQEGEENEEGFEDVEDEEGDEDEINSEDMEDEEEEEEEEDEQDENDLEDQDAEESGNEVDEEVDENQENQESENGDQEELNEVGDLSENELEGQDLEGEEDNENDNQENEEGEENLEGLESLNLEKPKRNNKLKVFLVSATLTKQFAGNKHKVKSLSKKEKKKLNKEKKEKKKSKEEEKEEKMIPKMEALMNKVKFTGKYKVIDLTQTMLIPKNLKEYKTVCIEEDKVLYLYHYLQQRPNENVIIFTNSISYAKKIVHLLEILGMKVLCLHSEMQQRQRLKKLDQFKSGQYKILVSTDVAARGLDIPSVQNVIHYQVPLDIDTYIHRSGRTARIGKAGICYTLIGPKDGQRFQKIIKQLDKEQGIQNIEINHTERDKIRILIDGAQQLEKSDFLVRQKQVEKAWYSKNAKLAEIEVDEEIKSELNIIKEDLSKKRVVMKQDKVEFKKIKEDIKQIHRRPNNMFLEPSQIQKYLERIEQLKASKSKNKSQQKEQNKQQQQQQQHQQQQKHGKGNKFQKSSEKNNKNNNNNNKNKNNNQSDKFNKKRRNSQR